MGKTGLSLKDGKVSPSGDALRKQLALWGPSVKPGDRAIITKMDLKNDRIHFEINGGPVKKTKWYQRVQVGLAETWPDPAAIKTRLAIRAGLMLTWFSIITFPT